MSSGQQAGLWAIVYLLLALFAAWFTVIAVLISWIKS
jgi:hypothetical protein